MVELNEFVICFLMILFGTGTALSVMGPNKAMEYRHLNMIAGNAVYSMRNSLGNLKYHWLVQMEQEDRKLFWSIWMFIYLSNCVIFINFIVARILSSYDKIKETIESVTIKELTIMGKDAEDFISGVYKK